MVGYVEKQDIKYFVVVTFFVSFLDMGRPGLHQTLKIFLPQSPVYWGWSPLTPCTMIHYIILLETNDDLF